MFGEGIFPGVGDVFERWLHGIQHFLHADEDAFVAEHFFLGDGEDFDGEGELGGDRVGVAFEFGVAVGTGFLDFGSFSYWFGECQGCGEEGAHEEGEDCF